MHIGNLPAASNRATYRQDFQVCDDETDEGIDLTGAIITLAIRKPGCTSPELTATTANGRIAITGMEEGRFELTFTAADMRRLDQMSYACGITIEQNGDVVQYFIGSLPVLDGITSS